MGQSVYKQRKQMIAVERNCVRGTVHNMVHTRQPHEFGLHFQAIFFEEPN